MAHYTIFELERIEKVLEAKLYAAKEAYNKRLDLLHRTFKEKVSFDPNNVISDEVKEAWATYQVNDMDLQLLLSETCLREVSMPCTRTGTLQWRSLSIPCGKRLRKGWWRDDPA